MTTCLCEMFKTFQSEGDPNATTLWYSLHSPTPAPDLIHLPWHPSQTVGWISACYRDPAAGSVLYCFHDLVPQSDMRPVLLHIFNHQAHAPYSSTVHHVPSRTQYPTTTVLQRFSSNHHSPRAHSDHLCCGRFCKWRVFFLSQRQIAQMIFRGCCVFWLFPVNQSR